MDQEGTQRGTGAATFQASAPAGDGRDATHEPLSMMAADADRSDEQSSAAAFSVVQRQGTTLTKAELADLLFEQVGLNKREAKDMVEAFFDEIGKALIRGESVKLSGFGNFVLRDKPQRPGRNPKTGEAIPISARRVVTFHASQKLKAQIDSAGSGGRVVSTAVDLVITDGS